MIYRHTVGAFRKVGSHERHIDVEQPIYIDEIRKHEIVYFTNNGGIALDHARNSLIVFTKKGTSWTTKRFAAKDIRSVGVEKVDFDPGHELPSGIIGIGHSLGRGLADTVRASRARRQTGVSLEIRSIDMPQIFLVIPDDAARAKIYEAVRQSFEGGLGGRIFHEIPGWVNELFKPGAERTLLGGSVETGEDAAKRFISTEDPAVVKRRQRTVLYSLLGGIVFVILLIANAP